MKTLEVIDVNDAYATGLRLILTQGELEESRNGHAYVLQEPLSVTYLRPQQRVLFDVARDANPFFHLFETLFYLAGRNDVRWLDRFVKDFSERFAEEDGHLHGSYGFRWRRHFDLDGEGNPNMPDQLDTVVRLLREDPKNRRVAIQMWDPVADLGQNFRDVPCNLMAVPRIVAGALDLTVFNRSNDFVWGMTGANAVQFSILQEYLAGRIGVGIGKYTQVSTNVHIYKDIVYKLKSPSLVTTYPDTKPMGNDWETWDLDLQVFFRWVDTGKRTFPYRNQWFSDTAEPLFIAHRTWKEGGHGAALNFLASFTGDKVAPDWRAAAIQWMQRRIDRMNDRAGITARSGFSPGYIR